MLKKTYPCGQIDVSVSFREVKHPFSALMVGENFLLNSPCEAHCPHSLTSSLFKMCICSRSFLSCCCTVELVMWSTQLFLSSSRNLSLLMFAWTENSSAHWTGVKNAITFGHIKSMFWRKIVVLTFLCNFAVEERWALCTWGAALMQCSLSLNVLSLKQKINKSFQSLTLQKDFLVSCGAVEDTGLGDHFVLSGNSF